MTPPTPTPPPPPPPCPSVGASLNINWILSASKPELTKDVQRYLWIFYFCCPCTTMSGKSCVAKSNQSHMLNNTRKLININFFEAELHENIVRLCIFI